MHLSSFSSRITRIDGSPVSYLQQILSGCTRSQFQLVLQTSWHVVYCGCSNRLEITISETVYCGRNKGNCLGGFKPCLNDIITKWHLSVSLEWPSAASTSSFCNSYFSILLYYSFNFFKPSEVTKNIFYSYFRFKD